jgi:N-acetylmuramoyl-L-alanine amidase
MKTNYRIIIVAAAAVAGCTFAAVADIGVKELPSGRGGTVPSLMRNGELLAAVPMVFERLGFKWRWDASARQLTCGRNARQYVFTQDIPYYSCGNELLRLPSPPARIGATLYLPLSTLLEIARGTDVPAMKWNAASQLLTINKSPYSIASVACEKKQNGVLVTIDLADSLPFDYTYYYPNVTINFFGATVDTSSVKSSRRIGIVDSLYGVQFDESAQVSLLVTREIEEPQIDYLQDLHTVLVSLRPKKMVTEVKPSSGGPNDVAAGGIRTVVIDPGHGGKDPGAIGPDGVYEKDITLSVALKLREMLRKKNGIKTFLTRESDEFVTLADRTRMANERNADLFVSIHVNAMPGSRKKKETTRGYKVYFLSQAKNEEDKLAAMRENAVIELEEKPQHYSALKNVLIDLAGNEYLRESQDLSILLDRQFDGSLHKKIPQLQPGIGQANFWVLNGAYMPSVLIETGFISSPSDEKVLLDKSYQKELADAIGEAVVNFKLKYEKEP